MKLSIIIPVYKGEKTLEPLFEKIKGSLTGIYDFEVIFICDKAADNSWDIIKKLNLVNPGNVKGISLKFNYGQHRALLHGIGQASGQILITMDEDLQHDPACIPMMVDFLDKNDLDVVYGKFRRFRINKMRQFESVLGRRIAHFLIPCLHKDYSPFRIIKATIAGSVDKTRKVVFLDALLGRVTSKIGVYTVEHSTNGRESSYSTWKLGQMAFSIFLWYSLKARVITGLLLLIFLLLLSGIVIPVLGPLNMLLIVLAGLVLYLPVTIIAHIFKRPEILVNEITITTRK